MAPPPPTPAHRTASSTSWQQAALERLVDHPERSLSLEQLGAALPQGGPACFLPWTRLQVSMSGDVGPCCGSFRRAGVQHQGRGLAELWNSEVFVAFRRGLAAGTPEATCRDTCPHLQAGSHGLRHYALHGGPEAFVRHQVRVAEQALAGALHVDGGPLALELSYTAACNYACVMCTIPRFAVEAPLSEAFFADIERALPLLRWLEIGGGEPLLSTAFLRLLDRFAEHPLPHLRLCVSTNGSRLAPDVLDRLERVRFENFNVSLNAATPTTYLAVQRGEPFETVRGYLADLADRVRRGRFIGTVGYSMVLLRSNVAEIGAFVEVALRDGARPRFGLPEFNLEGESVLVDADAMACAVRGLDEAGARVLCTFAADCEPQIRAIADILRARLASGVLQCIPDGLDEPPAGGSPEGA